MREIKFRGHTGQEWVYGNLTQFKDRKGNYHAQIEIRDINDVVGVDPESVGQFTGLVDKNGGDVFEGDILMIHNPPNQIQRMELICAVKYYPGAWYAFLHKTNIWEKYQVERFEKGHTILLVNMIGEKIVRTIGNVFEHPGPLICPAHKECNLKNHACNAGLCPWRIKD